MDQTSLIQTVQTYLDNRLAVPIRTEGGLEDERPVPVVILEDVDVTDLQFHNTNLVQVVETDVAGEADTRYFRFHYWARLDYRLRHTDDVSASQLRDSFRNLFLPLTENPRELADDINEVRLRGGGGFNLSQTEDTESAMSQAVRIRTFHQMNNGDDPAFDESTLDTIQNKLDDGDGDDFTVTN